MKGVGRMAEIIRYSNQFLPHVIRLFSPETSKIDCRLNYFRELFALNQPGPEQSCLLVKGKDSLLACAYLISLEKIQPGLVYVNLAVDNELDPVMWNTFWEQCCDLAKTIVKGPPVLRTMVGGDTVPALLQRAGFKVIREQVELHASIGQLPPVQSSATDDFSVVSLADFPEHEKNWLDIFNHGLTVFWDIPPLDTTSFQRLRKNPSYNPSAFRLGIGGEEPAAALFYTVLDSTLGIVRLNAAATSSAKRSKGYGRRMIKETLNFLEQQGFSTAVIYTDAANQAMHLLLKMLGFSPVGTIRILESQKVMGAQPQSPVEPEIFAEKEVAASDDTQENKPGSSFFPGFHSAFNGKKEI